MRSEERKTRRDDFVERIEGMHRRKLFGDYCCCRDFQGNNNENDIRDEDKKREQEMTEKDVRVVHR